MIFVLVVAVLTRYYEPMNSDIFILIERIANMLRYESRNQGAQLGLLPVQQEALYYLSICNRYSDTLLAVTDYLGLTKGTVSQTLKVLETKGLIEKKKDSVDKRVTHLTATQAGLDYLAQTYPSVQFREMVKGLSEQEHQLISSSLKTLLRHYQVSTGRKGFGVCQSCRYNQTTDTGFVCGLTQEPLGEQEIGLICREFVEKDKATQS
jgi:MarR family transcriptional regulator, organic hydroperoxide resistance regulator